MKLKSISWVPIIVPLALLIIIVCFIVPIIAEHRAKHELIFERIDKASNSRETYQAMLDMITSKAINTNEKKSRLNDMLAGDDISLKYAALRVPYGLTLGKNAYLKDFSDLKGAVVENMLLMSKEYSASESKDNEIKDMLLYSCNILRELGITLDDVDDIRANNDLPSVLRNFIESEIVLELKYPEQHRRYQQAIEAVKSGSIGTIEWNRIVEFSQTQSPPKTEDIHLWERIDGWRETVLRDATDAYDNMTPEVKIALWEYLKNVMASDDAKLRYRGLMGCHRLINGHFDEIKSIRDEMYSLLSEYEDRYDDCPIRQRFALILTKYFLAKGMYNEGEITKEEFEKVSEKSNKWLSEHGTGPLPEGKDRRGSPIE